MLDRQPGRPHAPVRPRLSTDPTATTGVNTGVTQTASGPQPTTGRVRAAPSRHVFRSDGSAPAGRPLLRHRSARPGGRRAPRSRRDARNYRFDATHLGESPSVRTTFSPVHNATGAPSQHLPDSDQVRVRGRLEATPWPAAAR